ncbi:lytic transglycosylase domain-containing protein [Rhizobium sp. SL42]|uniref:lytic transglycosylase domain-containing protein n=1 Tax=Rhizobium sp. SL42 TaxID=2806346 RepID=UPI001F2E39F0|nr:lytic transglycosylase domain-containing protein [Rhizobium sp. SL42]UJW74155.1 lytic transglycosylase domain-containing protein [Rhizobium sp. SL42]
MIVKKDRGIAICMAASLLAGLSGCTAIDENMKADLATTPVAKPNSAEMQAANTAEAISNGTTPTAATTVTTTAELAAANPGPAPIIPGTETAAPIPMLKESSLAATAPQTAATQALTTLATATPLPGVDQQAAITAGAAPMQAVAAAPGSTSASTTAETTSGTLPAPAPVVLAYAAPLRRTALTSFGDPFDITSPGLPPEREPEPEALSGGPTKLNALIKKYAKFYEIPEDLVHRVVKRESTYNPGAYHSGNYGLMQIRYNTAKAMGYNGEPSGLFDAETNIKYAVKYLKGAWLVADSDHDQAVRLYARGYYYDAKRKGMLHLTQ